MKHFLLLTLTFCSFSLWGQHTFEIKDQANDLPVANVEVLDSSKEILGVSNQDGIVDLKDNTLIIFIDHPGFPPQSIQLSPEQKVIYLNSDLVNLKDVEVIANDSKSLNLIRKVIENQKRNSPKSLSSYRYDAYTKLWVDAQGDSLVYIQNPKTEADSTQNRTKKLLENSMLFLSERAIEHNYDQKLGEKNEVKAARISGLKTPLYELIALQPISTEFNENEFNFFFRKFINPLSKAGLKNYNYIITDTIVSEGKKQVEVSFNSKNRQKKALYGYALIDLTSYALTKFYAENQTKAGSDTYIEMIYSPYKGVWIPARQVFKVDANNMSYSVEKDSINTEGEKVAYKENKKTRSWLTAQSTFSNFKTPIDFDSQVFKGYANEVKKEAFTDFNTKIKSFRKDDLTDRERTTYVKVDSIGKKAKVDRNIKLFRIITQQGWLNFGPVDLHLLDLLQFNDYEGYRLGLNFRTSHKFSQNFGLNTRVHYGLNDKVVKYGLGGWLSVNNATDAQLFADFSDDIVASGRFQFPNLNMFNYLRNQQEGTSDYLFIDKVNAQFGYRQDVWRKLGMELSFNYAKERSLFDYQFKDDAVDKTYQTNTAQLALRYVPKEEKIQTPMGNFILNSGAPMYFLTLNQGLNLLDGENEFTRIEFLTLQKLNIFKSPTYLNVRAGKVFGEVPVWHYFDGLGRARMKDSFWKRARIGGSQIFETMPQGVFVSDQFIFGSIKQKVLNLKVVKDKSIPIHLLYKAGVGNLSHKANHRGLNLQAMDQVYQEAGIEINKLVMGLFGVGMYYRFGAYNVGEFEKDFSIKAVINLGR